ncbi:MAG: hypothetical protein U0W24_09840 [Bacteroidales bacterium]
MKNFFISILLIIVFVNVKSYGQSDELDKLKNLVEKGNLQKAQAYCTKVTGPMSEKSASRFHAVMANAYYDAKEYSLAAEEVQKSGDLKLAIKIADVFNNSSDSDYNPEMAATLYKYGKEFDKAGRILFNQGKYKESAATCASIALKLNFGDSLFNQGKISESLYFYTRAKSKGKLFDNQKVLTLVYDKSAYKTAYMIQDYNETGFQMSIQGTVIDKMVEKGENQSFINFFLDSLAIPKNKQQEIMIEAFINNNMFDKAMNFCMEQKNPEQNICLSFYADKTEKNHPEISAMVNKKLNRQLVAQDLLTTYLMNETMLINKEWQSEPVDKTIIKSFYDKTKPAIEKCGENYCDFIKFTSNKCIIKKDELQKANNVKAGDYKKSADFLQAVLKSYCK